MSDLKKWYLGGMVETSDNMEFEMNHARGKDGRFVKKGEDEISQLAEEFSKSLSDKFNIPQKSLSEKIKQETISGNVYSAEDAHKVAKKFNDEISEMSKQYAKNVSKRLGMTEDECYKKIREAAFNGHVYSQEDAYRVCKSANKGEGGGGSSALEEVYKKGGFKHPEALAKADFEELGKMDDSRLDAEITMLKGKVEEDGKPLDKARLEAAEGIMKGRGEKSVKITSKEDYVKYAKKNFGDVFGKDIDSMSLKDLGRYREFLDWRVGLPSTAGGLHQTLRGDIEDLITEREKSLKK